ncbi:scf ubiquitin ligase subunit [Grosmannia clavigera kw1407]|uniref:Scf ubiquitin ligase subunit n=1 Tax=Grosmannia clavigera (strain kw1407 / UAMH 11150) TaxID=655863 RepID=F0XS11_GROCL|nr:scf ubiquitin ligase subunit [Grosmannia clavigera kw1407]EFW99547.1 scf ubiquitin ligase subunit [Grosmannia clavigera kw1407]
MMHKGGKIRPPRKATAKISGVNDFDQNWNLIQDALVDIHDQNAGRLSFEQLYRASYKIVLIKRGEDLYQRVKTFEERYFADKVIPHIWALVTRKLVSATLHNVLGSTGNERRALAETFLRGIKDSWERHNMSMNMVADVLMYLDRGYAQDATRPFIYATTIGLFRDHILRAPLPPSAWSETDQLAVMGGGRGVDIGTAAAAAIVVDGSCSDVASSSPSNSHPTIFTILNSVILDLINMDRDGDVIDRNLARNCVAILEALYETDDEHEDDKLYLTTFEPEFLHATYLFYHNECERLLRDGDARAWLRQTRRRLREEQERCGHTISQLSRTKVARVVECELVATHLEDFMALEGSGIKAMIDNDRLEDLAILYDLVCRVESKKTVLKQALQTRIVELGLEIEKTLKETDFSIASATAAADATKAAALSAAAQQTAAAIKWVTDILELKDKFDRLWLECFNKDIVLQSAMTSSFTELFRLCTRSAEYVSLFIDDCFKRGLRGKSDTEIDAALDKATVMIQHVTEKDMLERYYQKHLARRLLHNKSENPEAEKMLISRMQSELGKTFTAKFEGMFKDMATSEELTRDYGKYAKENLDDMGEDEDEDPGQGQGQGNQARIDLGVSVLTSNNWPPEVMGRASQLEESLGGGSSSQGGCIYPAEVQRLQASFLKFYLRNRSGRVLSWVGTAGSADMRCVFPPAPGHDKGVLSRERRYELSVPTYGMVVLLLFNALPVDGRLSFDEIQAKTNIPAADLTRALASLTIPPKCRVLTKEPASKTIRPGDRFGFNVQFASKTLKIKVPIINALSKIEGEDERKATEDKNNQTRSHTIDAAVVRIMKQRKELLHTALVTEVVTQLASLFRPEVSMIKKRIEDLISREYLERIEESDPPAYRYVA